MAAWPRKPPIALGALVLVPLLLAPEQAQAKRKDYCCSIPTGKRGVKKHDVRASHSLSAKWKCAKKSGFPPSSFGVAKGKCTKARTPPPKPTLIVRRLRSCDYPKQVVSVPPGQTRAGISTTANTSGEWLVRDAGGGAIRLEAQSRRGFYLRHVNFEVHLSESFDENASFREVPVRALRSLFQRRT